MQGNRSFLILGEGAADIVSLTKGGYEIFECTFSFEQGLDHKGKATTRVHAGTIHLSLPQLPTQEIIDLVISSKKYKDGMIVLLDHENNPVEKVHFENAACVHMELAYAQKGQSYTMTKLTLQAERIRTADTVTLDNDWKY